MYRRNKVIFRGSHKYEITPDGVEYELGLSEADILDLAQKRRKKTEKKDKVEEKIEPITDIDKKILSDEHLLYNILAEIGKNVVGNEDAALVLINKICLRLVKNATATSSNILLSERTGGGKDWLAKHVCQVMLKEENQYFYRTRLTKKVLDYWSPAKDGWHQKVLYISDPPEDLLKTDTFRTMASGGNATTTLDENRELVHIKIDGKPVMIVTSLNATIDEEGSRRWDTIRLDISKELTRAILRAKINKSNSIEEKPNEELITAIQKLPAVNVKIPFGEVIIELLPDNLLSRTLVDSFGDFIKSSAALHQFQRKWTDKNTIEANEFDFIYGATVFNLIHGDNSTALNVFEQEILKALQGTTEGLGKIANEIAQNINQEIRKVNRLLGELINKGYINSQKMYSEIAKKPCKHYFIKNKNDEIGLATVFKQCQTKTVNRFLEENSIKKEGFNTFFQLRKALNKKRKEINLKPLCF